MDTTQSLKTTLPGVAPLPFDATLLFKALQYQLLVAVKYCYDLAPDESLWLEVMGDVTVPGKTQTEVKLYSDNLTDSHANFWNTLKNWLHENFDRTSFKTLVLLTTQDYCRIYTISISNKRRSTSGYSGDIQKANHRSPNIRENG